jgi:gliding motility-associated-like protein
VGGDITYAYNGNNNYDITLTLWRDCFNSQTLFDNSATIYVYQTTGFTTTGLGILVTTLTTGAPIGGTTGTSVPPNIYNPCLTPPTNICVNQAIYTVNTTLPAIAGGYTLVYQRCCRNGGIQNITSPSSTGATYTCEIPGMANYANSSPTFNSFPPISICQNVLFTFNASATDADGDSMAYSLYTPYNGGSGGGGGGGAVGFDTVTWTNGYTLSNVMGGTPVLNINPTTGLLSVTPPTASRFVVGIAVKEYRNGVYLGTVRRDFQFNVTACLNTVTAFTPSNYTSGGINYWLSCKSNTVTFANTSSPINALTTFHWDFGVADSTNDTSSLITPTYTFPDTGTYDVTLIINPSYLAPCKSIAIRKVRVYAPFHVGDSINPIIPITCFGSIVNFIDTSRSILPTTRLWSFGDASYSTLKSAYHQYSTPGIYNVKLVVQNLMGCKDSLTSQVTITPKTTGILIPSLACDSSVKFIPAILASAYSWNFGDFTSSKNTSLIDTPIHKYSASGNYTIELITYPNTGCADTAYKTIYMALGLDADFNFSNVCFYDSAVFLNTSKQGAGTMTLQVWNYGDGSKLDTTMAATVKHLFKVGTYSVKLWITNTTGCTDSIIKQIIIHNYPVINALPADSAKLCYLDTLQLQASGGGTYKWLTNYSISNTTISNPLISPDTNSLYIVQVTSPFGCVYQDSIKINVITYIQHSVTNDTAICYGDTIRLKASSTEPGIIKYEWQTNYNISKLDTFNPSVWPKKNTDYIVLIRSGRCGNFDTTSVKVLALTTPYAGPDITICKNYSATLHGINATYYDWQPKDFLRNSSSPNPVAFPNATTTYYLTGIDTNQCLRPGHDSMIVFVDTFHYAEAGQDTNVVMNIPFQLGASGGKYYQWFPTTGLDNPYSATPNCTLTADQIYVVKVSDENGCYAYDTVHIFAFPQVVALMPNAFTPNSDGIDDIIIPIYAGIRRLDYFFIYNRLGEKVFSTTEMTQGWDGTYHHTPAETGTYVYYISGVDATGNGFIQKGDIILLR